MRAIVATHDEQARTADDIAAETADRDQLPDRVRRLLDRRTGAVPAGSAGVSGNRGSLLRA